MVSNQKIVSYLFAVLLSLGLPGVGQAGSIDDTVAREYWVDAELFSMVPGRGIDSYRGHGGGGAEATAKLGLGVAANGRRFDVDIQPKLKSRLFLVTVTIKPKANDHVTEARQIEYDLTDVNPQTLEIARDEDGRVYRLNLMPRAIERPKPKQFEARDLRLECWSFPSSPVILNDQDYLGRMGASYGELAWCDIPGLAKIEFSLVRFKDAQTWGTLEDGTIDIKHPNGTTLRISNVINGTNGQSLEGGPYQVWVRWLKPTQSVEEYRRQLKDQLAILKQRAADGDATVRPDVLQRFEKMSESDRPTLISFGVRPVNPADRVLAE